MPAAAKIVESLAAIANGWWPLAVLWHVYFGGIALALTLGVRPARRTVAILLAIPMLSVSALAWVHSNPFNGVVFAASGAVLIAFAARMKPGHVSVASVPLVLLGSAFFAFGWVYPHFLGTDSYGSYLYEAPTGLIPCPTLSIVIGLAVMLRGLESRTWSVLLGLVGGFYAAFGALVLGVVLDWMLLAGATTILVIGVLLRPAPEKLPT